MKNIDNLFQRSAVSQTQKAYMALETLIVTGELAPGSQWSESMLSERIGLGRSPTRDALQELAFQRLVRIAPRQGVFISEIDYQGQLKIIQCRREIERLILTQAAVCATRPQRDTMTAIVGQLGKLKTGRDIRAYMQVHFNLTEVLGTACRNSYAAEFYATLQTLARRFMYFHHERYQSLSPVCDLHIDQLQAIIDGQPEAALLAANARNDYAEGFAKAILLELIATSEVTVSLATHAR